MKIPFLVLMLVLIATGCANATTPTHPTLALSATTTSTPSPTSTYTPTTVPSFTPTPKPTSTPKPIAIIATSRPTGNPYAVRITGPIGQDYRNLDIPQNLWFQRVTWAADVRVEYKGGTILLSGASSGTKPLVVDDVLTIKILHESGTPDLFTYDFSADPSANGPQGTGPFDLTAFFHIGVNMLYVTIYDTGYSYWGTSGLWIVEFR